MSFTPMEYVWCLLWHLQDQHRNRLQMSACACQHVHGQRQTTLLLMTQQAPGGLQNLAHWMLMSLAIYLNYTAGSQPVLMQ